MARSVITAQTPLGNRQPNNLKGTIGVDLTLPDFPQAGYSVGVAGKIDTSADGGYGMVFSIALPRGVKVDETRSGSQRGPNDKFDYLYMAVVADPNSNSASTEYWEVWFNTDDVEGADWNSMVMLNINNSNYNYTLTKKRTGDDL